MTWSDASQEEIDETVERLTWESKSGRSPHDDLFALVVSTTNTPEVGLQSSAWYGDAAFKHIAGLGPLDSAVTTGALETIYEKLDIDNAAYPAAQVM